MYHLINTLEIKNPDLNPNYQVLDDLKFTSMTKKIITGQIAIRTIWNGCFITT